MRAEGLGHIAAALPNSLVRVLDLSGNMEIGKGLGAQHLANILLASPPSLTKLDISNISMDEAGAEVLAQALRQRSITLDRLIIGVDWPGEVRLAPISKVIAGLSGTTVSEEPGALISTTATVKHYIKHLQLQLPPKKDVLVEDDRLFQEALAQLLRSNSTTLISLAMRADYVGHLTEALPQSTSLTRLTFNYSGSCMDMQMLIQILLSSSTLEELDLSAAMVSGDGKRALFQSLKQNRILKVLLLDGWRNLEEDMFTDLLESLQVNTNLQRISIENTSWKREGREASIRQALRQVAYVSVLKHADIQFLPPRSGRLFLCGPGFAGKTTLRSSLIRLSKARHEMCGWLCNARLPWLDTRRTEGIEIEVLCEDDDMQITIWDLAGQDKFRTLQDHLFPSITQACVFFLVFSPYDQERKRVKPQWQQDLQAQLQDWLRFITSKTSNQGHLKASIQVFVILTHLDKMQPTYTSETLVDSARPNIDSAFEVFAGVLERSGSVPVFALNGNSQKDVASLLDSVVGRFGKLLRKKLLLVPQPCTHMSMVLAKWTARHPNRPIMMLSEFYDLCRKEVVALQQLAEEDDVLEAISSYLHDVGTIMFFKNLHFLVVNPNWVTQILLGQLIKFDDNKLPPTTNGSVTESQLELVLEKFVKAGKYTDFTEKDLMLLMLKLELCYKVETSSSGGAHYFVPTTLTDANGDALEGKRPVSWPVQQVGEDCIHMGRRLQCKDKTKAILGPSFFPRLQVRLRNRLFEKTEMGMKDDQYKIQRNLIMLHTDGIQVIVESPGDIAEYVDILVKSGGKTREQTMAFLMEHVVEEVQSFRESPQGSPGVLLIEGIIRPACVSDLTLCAHRRSQSVLKEELINQLLGKDFGGVLSSEDSFAYQHTWSAVPDAGLEPAFEKATDLLGPRDVLELLSLLEQQVTRIDEAARLVLGESLGGDEIEEAVTTGSSRNPKGPVLKSTMSDIDDPSRRVPLSRQLHYCVEDVKNHTTTENKMLHKKLDRITSLTQQTLQQQKHTLNTVLAKMDQIMNFSVHLVATEVPRRPYFTTEDVGMVHRLVAGTRIGKAVMLHFMCEAGAGHIVEGQVGHQLIVEDADWKWIRPIAVNAVRLFVFLVKAGLHVGAGIGDAVPDYANWGGAIPLTATALAGETLLSDMNPDGYSTCSTQDWDALREKVKQAGKITDLFGLFRVRYTGGHQQGVAWVCRKCLDRGKKNGVLNAL